MFFRNCFMKWMLAGFLATGSVSRDDDVPIEGDLKTIQGEWTVPSGFGGNVSYTFKGKTLSIESPNRSYKMTIKLDPKAKPEKSINFHIDEGPDDAKGKDSKGIYQLEGEDTLTLCFSGEGDRPTKFEQIGFEQILTKLKRKKSAEKKTEDKKPGTARPGTEPKSAPRLPPPGN
jgi:uncharacterized protein (TIGR03067 family)